MADAQVDDLDLQLIELLSRDARVSNRKVASELGVTEGTVRGRIKRLQQDGLIAFTAITSFGMAQKSRLAFISIQAEVRTAAGLSAHAMPLPTDLPPLPEALGQAVQTNPQWLNAQAGLTAARATESARQAEAWQPSIDAVASASRTRQTQRFEGVSERQNVNTQAVGVQLNWPLFSGGYQQGRVQEATALLTRAQAQLDQIEAEVHTSLRDAYQRLAQAH